MHHGQSRGVNEKHRKYVNTRKFYKIRRKFGKESRSENNNLSEIRKKCTETAQIGRNDKIFS